MHVQQISHGAQKGQNTGRWVDVYIRDHVGGVVANATVTATASGFDNQTGQNITETKSGVTGSDGKVRITTAVDSSASFCVNNVTHATLVYDPNQNLVTCVNW